MRSTEIRRSLRLLDWIEASAGVVDALGSPALTSEIDKSMSAFLSYENCKQYVYYKNAAPRLLYNSAPTVPGDPALANYLGRSYELNPLYRRFRRGRAAGVFRMRDIAERNLSRADVAKYPIALDVREEIGFLTEGYPPNTEELCVGLELDSDRCIAICFSRERSASGYSDDELGHTQIVLPFLTSIFKQSFAKGVGNVQTQEPEPLGPASLGKRALLTRREAQVVDLLIKGHSSISIGLHLGVSTTTVKSHRKNIYGKLNIATMAELFSLAMRDEL